MGSTVTRDVVGKASARTRCVMNGGGILITEPDPATWLGRDVAGKMAGGERVTAAEVGSGRRGRSSRWQRAREGLEYGSARRSFSAIRSKWLGKYRDGATTEKDVLLWDDDDDGESGGVDFSSFDQHPRDLLFSTPLFQEV